LLGADSPAAGRGVVFPSPHVFGLPDELSGQTNSVGVIRVNSQRGEVVNCVTAADCCPGLEDTEVSLPSHHLRSIWMKVWPVHVYIGQYQ